MNRFRLSVAVVLFLLAVAPAGAQFLPALLRPGLASFQSGYNDWDRTQFVAAAQLFAAAREAFPTSSLACYWEGVAELHGAFWCIEQKGALDPSWLSGHLGRAKQAFESAVRLDPDDGECQVLLGTAVGMQIRQNPVSAVWHGRRVLACERKALELAPDNPRVHYLIGSGDFHAPGLRSAKDHGLAHFLEAERLYEQERKEKRDPLRPSWGYGSCLTFLGRISAISGDPSRAAAYFQRALRANPRDRFAKQGLEDPILTGTQAVAHPVTSPPQKDR